MGRRVCDVEFINNGGGGQDCFCNDMPFARIHQTEEGEYLVEFFVRGIDVDQEFLPSLTMAQFVVWGAVAACMSKVQWKAVRTAALAKSKRGGIHGYH